MHSSCSLACQGADAQAKPQGDAGYLFVSSELKRHADKQTEASEPRDLDSVLYFVHGVNA